MPPWPSTAFGRAPLLDALGSASSAPLCLQLPMPLSTASSVTEAFDRETGLDGPSVRRRCSTRVLGNRPRSGPCSRARNDAHADPVSDTGSEPGPPPSASVRSSCARPRSEGDGGTRNGWYGNALAIAALAVVGLAGAVSRPRHSCKARPGARAIDRTARGGVGRNCAPARALAFAPGELLRCGRAATSPAVRRRQGRRVVPARGPCAPLTIWSTMPPTALATMRGSAAPSPWLPPQSSEKPSAMLFWTTTAAWRWRGGGFGGCFIRVGHGVQAGPRGFVPRGESSPKLHALLEYLGSFGIVCDSNTAGPASRK